jgi:hypothetical protein
MCEHTLILRMRRRRVVTPPPPPAPRIAISLGHDRVDGGRQVGEIA